MAGDYEVGYKRPPKHTRFQPGQSGNPKGRPKGAKNLRTDLQEELAERVSVTEGGQQLVITKQRAMLKSLLARSIKGDTAAARALINLIVGIEQADAERSAVVTTTAEDLEILEAFKARVLGEGHPELDENEGDEP